MKTTISKSVVKLPKDSKLPKDWTFSRYETKVPFKEGWEYKKTTHGEYIKVAGGAVSETIELRGGLHLDLTKEGVVVGVEIV